MSRLDQLCHDNEQVNLDGWFNFFAFDVVGEVTFSRRFDFLQEGRDIGGVIANSRTFEHLPPCNWTQLLVTRISFGEPIIGWLKLQPSNHIFELAEAVIKARMDNDGARRDMIEQWLETKRAHPDRMEDKEIVASATVNMAAGADTISAALQPLLYNLIRSNELIEPLSHVNSPLSAATTGISSAIEGRKRAVLKRSVVHTISACRTEGLRKVAHFAAEAR